jgi:hypothetical protein
MLEGGVMPFEIPSSGSKRDRSLLFNAVRMLFACVAGTLLHSCSTVSIITSGHHTSLPHRNASVVVVGESPIVVAAASTWLKSRGLSVVELPKIRQAQDFAQHPVQVVHSATNGVNSLESASLLGASLIVFLEMSDTVRLLPSESTGVNVEVAYHKPRVSVRAVDTHTREEQWVADARFMDYHPDLGSALESLTCQALGTAWGFRPPGESNIPSSELCNLQYRLP